MPDDVLLFADIQALAKEICADEAQRDSLFAAMECAWNLDPQTGRKEQWWREAVSPDPHNAVKWVVDLLISNAPLISIPAGEEKVTDKERADRCEKGLELIIERASRQRGKLILEDAALSGTLFSAVAMKVARTQDIADSTKGKDKKRFTELAKRCPFLVDVLHPGQLYVRGTEYGTEYVVEKRSVTVSSIRARWGSELCKGKGITDKVVYLEYWDDHQYCKWIENEVKPLEQGEYKSGIIPYVYVTGGSKLFDAQPKLYPLLFAAVQSKAWQQQSMLLSTMSTMMFGLVNQPVIFRSPSGRNLDQDISQPGGVIPLHTGEEILPFSRDLITPDMQALFQLLTSKVEESTVPKILGGHTNLSSAIAYSTLNLVTQSGRLVVQPIQELVAYALSSLCEKILEWIVYSGQAVKLRGRGNLAELKPTDIDKDWIEVEVTLRPDFPQDRLQIGNLVSMLNKAGILSKETGREMMGFMQPKEEETKLLEEAFVEAHLREMVEQVGKDTGLAALIQADQQFEQEPPPEAMPGMPGVPQVMQQGAPPPEFMQSAAENMSAQEEMQ